MEHGPAKPTQLILADLDRCICATGVIFDDFVDFAVRELPGLSKTAVRDARLRVEVSGGSFNVLEFLGRYFDSDRIEELCRKFGEIQTGDDARLFEPGAQRYLESLDTRGAPWAILTYGNELNQRTKIARLGLAEMPHIIVSDPNKRSFIELHYADSRFSLADVALIDTRGRLDREYETVELIDDKASAFGAGELPHWLTGVLVRPMGKRQLASQLGSVPAGVRTVSRLDELI